MIQKFKQFRFYNNSSNNNSPSDLTREQLLNGSCFFSYLPAVEIGISALPGTKFYLNDGSLPVMVNYSGLFDLDLNGQGTITSLKFNDTTLKFIEDNDSAYLLIDIVYLGSEE